MAMICNDDCLSVARAETEGRGKNSHAAAFPKIPGRL